MEQNELLEALLDERQELVEMLEDLPDEVLIDVGVIGDWTIKDILNHLTFWEGQVVTLLYQARQGMPRPSTVHFSKETADAINQRWYAAGLERPLETVWQDWLGVRKQLIRRVSEMSSSDLNDPQRYAWLKGVPLYQWVLNDSIEHEEEHADQIRDWLDRRDAPRGGRNGSDGGSA